MDTQLDKIRAEMESVKANVKANIQNGKVARSEDVRDAFVKIADAIIALAEAEFKAH